MAQVVIFGNTNPARTAYWHFTHDSAHEVVAFTVDRGYIQEDRLFDLPVVPFDEVVSPYPPNEFKMFVAISFGRVNKLRAEKYQQTKAKGYELVTYISSKTTTWPGLTVGDNCFIGANSTCQPFAKIGNDVHIMTNCVVAHHTHLKDHCFLAAGTVILGRVVVEPYCFFGANSTVRNDITVARECVIGAGALILKDTRKRGVYRGNPFQAATHSQ